MMEEIKVFLVEDEIVIRNGIRKSINWEKEGYCFVGEASDGELAYPMIIKEKPDILITDIKMPFVDGLELSALVKKEIPDIKILILSGYDEFSYAKEAIKIGVTEYMLKPVSATKLLEALGEISEVIRQEKRERACLKQYMEEMKENAEQEKLRFFNHLVLGGKDFSLGEMIETGKKYNMNLSASCFNVVLFKILSPIERTQRFEKVELASDTIEKELEMVSNIYGFKRGIDGWGFILTADSESQMERRIQHFTGRLKDIMKKWKDLDYFGGIGKSVYRLRAIGDAFSVADMAFALRFTHDANQIVSGSDLSKVFDDEKIEMQGFIEIGKSREMIEKFLNNGTIEEVESFSDAYIMRMEADNMKSMMVRQYIVMDICMVIMSFCKKINASDAKLQQDIEMLQREVHQFKSLNEIRKYMIELLTKTIELRDKLSERRYSDVINSAKDEIAKMYMTDEISLNSIANSVGMSASYFSSVFSKEVGKTFVEYLTEVRIEKAKELLMCSSMKTSEISYMVGYKDPHYFSYIFKKKQGCSPKDYRARRKD